MPCHGGGGRMFCCLFWLFMPDGKKKTSWGGSGVQIRPQSPSEGSIIWILGSKGGKTLLFRPQKEGPGLRTRELLFDGGLDKSVIWGWIFAEF